MSYNLSVLGEAH